MSWAGLSNYCSQTHVCYIPPIFAQTGCFCVFEFVFVFVCVFVYDYHNDDDDDDDDVSAFM